MPSTDAKLQGGGKAFRIGWLTFISLSILIALVAMFPLLAAMAAGAVASLNGCMLNEGGANPCVIAGIDFGNALYFLGVLGWLAIATVPMGIGVLAVWVFAFGVIALRAKAIDSRTGNGA
jgi:hypothetical protein